MKRRKKLGRRPGTVKSKIALAEKMQKEDRRNYSGIGNSLMPISLRTLTRFNAIELRIIILEREKAFYRLRDEYLEMLHTHRVDEFQLERIKLSLTSTQDGLIESVVNMRENNARLEWRNSNLRSTIHKQANHIRLLEEMRKGGIKNE